MMSVLVRKSEWLTNGRAEQRLRADDDPLVPGQEVGDLGTDRGDVEPGRVAEEQAPHEALDRVRRGGRVHTGACTNNASFSPGKNVSCRYVEAAFARPTWIVRFTGGQQMRRSGRARGREEEVPEHEDARRRSKGASSPEIGIHDAEGMTMS